MKTDLTFENIYSQARKLGWDDVGITVASIPEEDILSYKEWISKNQHSGMGYMEKEMRCDPQLLLPGARSAILFISYYKQEKKPFRKDSGLIASYARGKDYHNVHHRRLKKFIRWLHEKVGDHVQTKAFSDSAPILEKALAVQAGLGWFGKNTLLIHRRFGTFTLLSGLLTNLDLNCSIQAPRLPKCGSCTRCLEACPTGALVSPYTLDASLCLSYHTIETKGEIPQEISEKNPGYVFGCDECQDACPHNARKEVVTHGDFTPEAGIGDYLSEKQLEQGQEGLYGTPLKRRGVNGLLLTLANITKEIKE